MKKTFKLVISVILLILLIAASSMNMTASFGDYSSDSDYGYDSYDSYDSYDYDYDYDYDYGGSSYSGGTYSGSAGSDDPFVIIMSLIFMFCLFFFPIRAMIRGAKSGTSGKGPVAPGATPTVGLLPISSLISQDPNFSADELCERLSSLYIQMENCWMAKDLSPIRGSFTDDQFAQYDNQLKRYRDTKTTSMSERVAVLDVSLKGFKQDNVHDILVANVYTRVNTYVIDDVSGKILSGNKNAEKFIRYEWTLVRPKGSITQTQVKDQAFNCPNCGGHMDINQSARCPFCDSIVKRTDYDWAISGIKALSQRTK